MSMVISVADALVALLNTAQAGTFTHGFTAERQYRPEFDLAQLKTLRVTVVPKRMDIASLGRSSNQHDVAVDVAVQKKLAAISVAEIDPLMKLVEQIEFYLRQRRITIAQTDSAIWVRTENSPIYAPEHLEQMQVFTSVLTVTYRVVK